MQDKEHDIFYKAVKSRDYRFDGKFFVGVKTTGIYCRPVCPAQPKRKNMIFYKTAINAERAGFRPCLRCRPEVAPNSGSWIGTSATVKRALALIHDGFLNDNYEKKLANKLGVGERHVRRLFDKEIGLSPKQVSDFQRLNFARTLIMETEISITEIAFSSGFQSIRRFNDAFKNKFSKTPSEIRKKTATKTLSECTTLKLRYRPPYDWDALLAFYKTHCTPRIENVTNDTYERIFIDEYNQKPAFLTVKNSPDENCLKLEIYGASTKSLFTISIKIRKMFDLDSDPLLVSKVFEQSKLLTKIYNKNPGLRIPGAWDAFETSIAIILGQLVSVKQGRVLLDQLIIENGKDIKHNFPTNLNYIFPTPKALTSAQLLEVRTTVKRKETIRELASKIHNRKIDYTDIADFDKLKTSLNDIKGIGPWSIECIFLRTFSDTNAFPAKDLVIAQVLQKHKEINSKDYEPWRSYLTLYLWKEFANAI